MSNRLQYETSPYLLSHAENPVDWYPWGEEAFQRAKEEEKPVFLSIGYSSCHWCHVMARESFEDEEIARILNRNFISVKVDKEERPDIDSIYMRACQAFTGSGGWPASIFMTADQKPFFAGTYFPKNRRHGMIGLKELLNVIWEKWENDRETLLDQAERLVEAIADRNEWEQSADSALADSAARLYEQLYDRRHGGFGKAPKFPAPHNLWFLLEYDRRKKNGTYREMAEHTLLQMYRGGLFDHIGFGFCRYSTDERFLIPHFEKMLYDNALMILACCKAQAGAADEKRSGLYLQIAEKTADYILREMTSPQGGFYSAQDADSEGEEGKYYLFTPEEITGILGPQEGEAFNRFFDITEAGNFEGKNIPNLLSSDPMNHDFEVFLPQIAAYRQSRMRLHTDYKILTAWNGWMIAALCRLYLADGQKIYLRAAQAADRCLKESVWESNGTLYASFTDGKRGVRGFLDDYAACIFAQIALYQATMKKEYLQKAKVMCRKVKEIFSDPAGGGFYFSGKDHEKLILRPKETYDGAIPSGNSLMAFNLVRLWHLTGEETYRNQARKQLDFLSAEAAQYPTGYALFLLALLEFQDAPARITVVLDAQSDQEELLRNLPEQAMVTLLEQPTGEFPLKEGKTTFYVCSNDRCFAPVHHLEQSMMKIF